MCIQQNNSSFFTRAYDLCSHRCLLGLTVLHVAFSSMEGSVAISHTTVTSVGLAGRCHSTLCPHRGLTKTFDDRSPGSLQSIFQHWETYTTENKPLTQHRPACFLCALQAKHEVPSAQGSFHTVLLSNTQQRQQPYCLEDLRSFLYQLFVTVQQSPAN